MNAEQNFALREEFYKAICFSSIGKIREAMKKGISPKQLLPTLAGSSYSGNAFHAFAKVSHSGFDANDEAVVKFFLSEGVDINAHNDAGETPLITAIKAENLTEHSQQAIQFMVANGADMLKRDREGRSAVDWAHQRSLQAHSILIEAANKIAPDFELKARKEAEDAQLKAKAKLMFDAVRTSNLDQVRLLVGNGVPYDVRDTEGATPLHYAVRPVERGGYVNPAKEVMAYFVNKGLNVDVQDKNQETALHYVAKKMNEYTDKDKVNDLIIFGADINVANKDGLTPLHYAAKVAIKEDIIKVFIDNSAKVNVKTNNGETPLHFAARNGHEPVIRALIEAGADMMAVTQDGKHIWDYAVAGGKEYLAQTLKRRAIKQAKSHNVEAAPVDPWVLMSPVQVAYMQSEKSIGYKLTEIFNFETRIYTYIARNLKTNAEGIAVKTFDEFSDTALLEKAHDELTRLDGKADRDTINGPALGKMRKGLGL